MAEMKTNKKILNAAQDLLSKGGANAVSFDKVATELGITKQAVLYWFPSKSALLAAMFIDWLDTEAQAAEDALIVNYFILITSTLEGLSTFQQCISLLNCE